MQGKRFLVILGVWVFSASLVFGEKVSEAQAKVDVNKAKRALKSLLNNKKLSRYLPYRETSEAVLDLDKAIKYLDDGEYDEASFFATLSYLGSRTALNKAEAWKIEVEMIRFERDYYKKQLDKVKELQVRMKLLEAGLSPSGRVYKGSYPATELFVNPRRRNYSLTAKAKKKLALIAEILNENKKARIRLEGHASRDYRRRTTISESYIEAIKSFFIEQGITEDRIQSKAWGRAKYKRGGINDRVDIILQGL